MRATGPYAPKLQALWLSAYHLGVVRERDDAALLAFVKRQTTASHTRFLIDPKDAALVIEAIKAMLVRAGVVWPAKPGPGAIEIKRAVVAAQIRRLAALGVEVASGAPEPRAPADAAPWLDAYARRLGGLIRDVLAHKGDQS